MTVPEFTNEIVTTIVESLEIDEYEAEYEKIVKIYADWVTEMLQVSVIDHSTLNRS